MKYDREEKGGVKTWMQQSDPNFQWPIIKGEQKMGKPEELFKEEGFRLPAEAPTTRWTRLRAAKSKV